MQTIPAFLFLLNTNHIEQVVFVVKTTGMTETNQKAIQNRKNFDHEQHKRKPCYRLMF